MCGIAAIIRSVDDPHIEARIRRMLAVIGHRGPDGNGVLVIRPGRQALGHVRLSIIDIASGHQPMADQDLRTAITYNGEIYNFPTLRLAMEAKGINFKTKSDTEVVMRTIEHSGVDGLKLLSGMFSIVQLMPDGRFCIARDRFGIKPLYYAVLADGIVVCSEIKGILASGLIPPEIDLVHVAAQLRYGYAIDDSTIIQGVRSLPPGEYLVVKEGIVASARYYDISNMSWSRSPLSFEDAKAELADRMAATVESHLLADVKVATALSGGLDSSVITALAAHRQPTESCCVKWGRGDDETPFAREVAIACGSTLREEMVEPQALTRRFAKLVYHLEEPSPHTQVGTTWSVARGVRTGLDAKVALVGDGADEVFCGYPWIAQAAQWRHRVRGSRHVIETYQSAHFSPVAGLPLTDVFERDGSGIADALVEGEQRRFSKYLRAAKDCPHMLVLFDIGEQLPGAQLNRVDKLYMAHSVEARVPYLDHQLVEFALGLPLRFKLASGINKYILRQSFSTMLPPSILNRAKFGPGGTQNAFGAWFEDGNLGKHLKDLTVEHLFHRGLFSRVFLERAVRMEITNAGKLLLFLGMLSVLIRSFVDGVPPMEQFDEA